VTLLDEHAALTRAAAHNVGWLDVPAADVDQLAQIRASVERGLFRELGRLPAYSPNITFKITEEGRAALARSSLAA
jgi:hypothetical protein